MHGDSQSKDGQFRNWRPLSGPAKRQGELSSDEQAFAESETGNHARGALSRAEQVTLVPLPNDVPLPPDLSALPPHILHSNTVETLIGQNEDLMARLKVNLRRNSILENQLLEQQKQNAQMRQLHTTLASQVDVLKEKDRIWKDKNQRIENQFKRLKDDVELYETRFAELYNASLEKQERIRLLDGFRRRALKWVRAQVDRLKFELNTERAQTHMAREETSRIAAQTTDMRVRISDLVNHIQNQEKNFQKDQAKLVEQYESRLAVIKEENEKLNTDMRVFKDRAMRLDAATQRHTEAENRAVLHERRAQELERKINTDVVELQAQMVAYRSEAKALSIDLETARERLGLKVAETEEATTRLSQAQDRLESLQLLWSDTRKQIEELRLKNQSLQELNQELSRKLKENRGVLDSKTPAPTPSEANVPFSIRPARDGRSMNRIDTLLAEIQSGFPISKTAEADRVRGLDIIESGPDADAANPKGLKGSDRTP